MELRSWTPALAKDQADLFNRSDLGWPATITHGFPLTPQAVRTMEARARSLGVWLAYEGRVAVGYVRLTEMWGDNEAAYVSFLSVDPSARGTGVGKALVFRCLQESLARGYPRLDLHTWPGNDRAMRLYKRTGFMWTPNTAVYMQNHLPQILLFPPAKAFFARHDWYRSYRRKITFDEDEEKVGKAKVFTYQFTAGKESLTIWIDPRSKGIAGYETPEVRVFARPEGPLVAGGTRRFLWEVRNKGKGARHITAGARTSGGFTISEVRPRRVASSKTGMLTATVSAPPDLYPKTEDERPHRVDAELRVDGVPSPLTTAVEVSRPLSASVPGLPVLHPESARDLTLVLTAGADGYHGPVELASDELAVTPDRVSVRLRKGKEKALAVTLTPRTPAARYAHLRVVGRAGTLDAVHLPVAQQGDSVAMLDRDGARLRSRVASVHIATFGGGLSVRDAEGETVADWIHLRVGPGLWPSELNGLYWNAEVDEHRGQASLTVSPPRRDWLTVTQTVRLRHDIVEIEFTLANRSRREQSLPLSLAFFPNRRTGLAFAARDGVRKVPVVEWELPSGRDDLPERGFAEGWLHIQGAHPMAITWDETVFDRTDLIWWTLPSLLAEVTVPPGGQVRLPPVAVAVGTPTWEAARALWARRRRKALPRREARDVRSLTARPPAALAAPGSRLQLRMEVARRTPERGNLTLDLPRGFLPKTFSARVDQVDLARPWVRDLRLRGVPARPGIHTATATFSGELRDWSTTIPLLVPRGRVTARAGKVATLQGGGVDISLARDFGTIISLGWRGREYLHSPYPEETAWAWFRPWCGGAAPSWNETLERKGLFGKNRLRVRSGRGWAGFVLTPRTKPKGLAGLEFEAEYTAFAGLPLLALSYRVKNTGRERRRVNLGFSAFPRWFRGPGELRLGDRLATRLRAGTITAYQEGCGPVVASVAPSGETLAVIAGPGGDTDAVDMGIEGRFPSSQFRVPLEPRESRCLTTYLVAARSVAEAWAYQGLHVATVDDLLGAPPG